MARNAYKRQSAWENPIRSILPQTNGHPSEAGAGESMAVHTLARRATLPRACPGRRRIIEASRFPEPGGRSGRQPSPKHVGRACEFSKSVGFKPHDDQSPGVSSMPVLIGHVDRETSRHQQLLAL